MTDQPTVNGLPAATDPAASRAGFPVGRTLAWLGIAGASAALTFFIVRASFRAKPAGDETTDRIQALIDEANRLIKTLDEKKPV